MMNQNRSCGCNRCNGRSEGERINVGRCGSGNGRGRCRCQNTCQPRTCCHPCRTRQWAPRPCCERNCEERAREVFRNEVENAREEMRCSIRNCRRDRDCGCWENRNNECGCRDTRNNSCGCRENRSNDCSCGCRETRNSCCDNRETRNNNCGCREGRCNSCECREDNHDNGCGCGRSNDLDDDDYHCSCRGNWEDESDDVNDQIYRTQTIGMAYVPGQRWKCPMEKEEGFCKGTIFHDLCKPFKGECK